MKGVSRKLIGVFLSFTLFFGLMLLAIAKPIDAFAYNEDDYRNAGINFLEAQYEMKALEYEHLTIADAINLYDEHNKMNAKLLILDRDGEWDYVILDFVIDRINGFGINEYDYLQNFYNKGNIYYAGQMNFAFIANNQYYDFNEVQLNKNAFLATMQEYKLLTPKVSSGNEGILSWNTLRNERHSSLSNTDWGYLPGFNWNGISSNSAGIKATYFSQTTFNNIYNTRHPGINITGTCGPTAMTNMAIYFEWLGYNGLINNEPYDTFEWFLNDLNWFNWENTWWTNTKNSFRNYANNRAHGYDITNYDNPTFNDFKKQISNGRPIYTYLLANQTDGTSWAHAVVTVGFEQFTYYYQVNERWWFFGWHDKWVTKETNYYYLRCIDGWSTSNSGHFVDFNNFYSIVRASAFKLK